MLYRLAASHYGFFAQRMSKKDTAGLFGFAALEHLSFDVLMVHMTRDILVLELTFGLLHVGVSKNSGPPNHPF